MKKLIAIFAMLAVSAFAQAGTLTLAGPASYSGTSPITINLNWNWSGGAVGPADIQFSWTASTSVSGISAGAIATAASKQIVCGGTFPQLSGTCIIYGMNTTMIGSGVVALSIQTAPASGPVTFTISPVLAADPSGLLIASTGGSISIPFANKCDITGNSVVDSGDVTAIAQRITAKPQVTPCDFNGDSVCDLFDLVVIRKAALGGACTAP